MHYEEKFSWLKHLDFMVLDLIVLVLSFSVSYYFKFGNNSWVSAPEWVVLLVILCFLNIIISFIINPYSGVFKRAYYEDVIKYLLVTIYNALVTCVIFYVFKVGVLFSREMLIEMFLAQFIVSFIVKFFWKQLMLSGKIGSQLVRKNSLYIVAPKELADDVKHNALTGDFQQFELVGICDETELNNFADIVVSKKVDDVLIAINPSFIKTEDYKKIVDNGISIHLDVETLLGFKAEEQVVTNLGVYNTLSVRSYSFTQSQRFYLIIKRFFDIVFGLIGFVFLLPLIIIIKLCFLLGGDTKSIFYTQKRVGLNGKEIRIFKFRSMVPNADEVLVQLLKEEKYRKEWEANQKFENDPRITKIGSFLRKSSLDEIPQVINVLIGDMSLVGPRPLVKGELEAHNGLNFYTQVKPGITGWWGCNGRSNIDYQERLNLEYYYIKNYSLYLDALCIIRTIIAVLKHEGSK